MSSHLNRSIRAMLASLAVAALILAGCGSTSSPPEGARENSVTSDFTDFLTGDIVPWGVSTVLNSVLGVGKNTTEFAQVQSQLTAVQTQLTSIQSSLAGLAATTSQVESDILNGYALAGQDVIKKLSTEESTLFSAFNNALLIPNSSPPAYYTLAEVAANPALVQSVAKVLCASGSGLDCQTTLNDLNNDFQNLLVSTASPSAGPNSGACSAAGLQAAASGDFMQVLGSICKATVGAPPAPGTNGAYQLSSSLTNYNNAVMYYTAQVAQMLQNAYNMYVFAAYMNVCATSPASASASSRPRRSESAASTPAPTTSTSSGALQCPGFPAYPAEASVSAEPDVSSNPQYSSGNPFSGLQLPWAGGSMNQDPAAIMTSINTQFTTWFTSLAGIYNSSIVSDNPAGPTPPGTTSNAPGTTTPWPFQLATSLPNLPAGSWPEVCTLYVWWGASPTGSTDSNAAGTSTANGVSTPDFNYQVSGVYTGTTFQPQCFTGSVGAWTQANTAPLELAYCSSPTPIGVGFAPMSGATAAQLQCPGITGNDFGTPGPGNGGVAYNVSDGDPSGTYYFAAPNNPGWNLILLGASSPYTSGSGWYQGTTVTVAGGSYAGFSVNTKSATYSGYRAEGGPAGSFQANTQVVKPASSGGVYVGPLFFYGNATNPVGKYDWNMQIACSPTDPFCANQTQGGATICLAGNLVGLAGVSQNTGQLTVGATCDVPGSPPMPPAPPTFTCPAGQTVSAPAGWPTGTPAPFTLCQAPAASPSASESASASSGS